MREPLIYVAGPYSSPDPCENTHRAVEVANELVGRGLWPHIPHLTHFWHTMTPKPYSFWLEYDKVALRRCDAVLRFDPERPSSGADGEVALALELGIPVFYSVEEVVEWASVNA